MLFKLFRIEEHLEKNADEITTLAASISGLREEKETHDSALDDARADQAKARSAVAKAEKKIKKAEKALEDKVRTKCFLLFTFDVNFFWSHRNQISWPSRRPLLIRRGS